ncbi:MAG: efflux RND transporter permease subunit [Comamonadaceae bacterium]|nr:efflux RND transporter permease subunit [Comamonadaceae bacterium]
MDAGWSGCSTIVTWLLAGFVAAAVAGGFATVKLGSEFLPQMDDGRILVKVKLPTGAALAETDRVLREIEQRIGDDKRIESLFAMAGGKAVGTVTFEVANEGELNLQLTPPEARKIGTAGLPRRAAPPRRQGAGAGRQGHGRADQGQGPAQAGRRRHRGENPGRRHRRSCSTWRARSRRA